MGSYGISVLEAPLNMSDLVNWKDSIVDRLNKGESLLKMAGAEFMDGQIHGTEDMQGRVRWRVNLILRPKMDFATDHHISIFHSCHVMKS